MKTFSDWLATKRSEATKRDYRAWGLEVMGDPDGFAKLALSDHEAAEAKVLGWVMEARKRIPSTVKVRLAPTKGFLKANRARDFDWEGILAAAPPGRTVAKDRTPTKAELQAMKKVAAARERFIICAYTSGGPRRGMFYYPTIRGGYEYMRLRDMEELPNGCLRATVYRGEAEEYQTYFSPEAADELREYLRQRRESAHERLGPDSPVLRDSWDSTVGRKAHPEDAHPLQESAVYHAIYNARRRAGIRASSKDGGFKASHGLRKYFRTNARKAMPSDHVEILMGHAYSYEKPAEEELMGEYLRALPYLLIDEKYTLKAEKEAVEVSHRADYRELTAQLDHEKVERLTLASRYSELEERQRKTEETLKLATTYPEVAAALKKYSHPKEGS